MKSTRDRILQTLLHQPRASINKLAEAVGINPISVRHHLTNLQMEGLVDAQEERHGVGRPRLVYVLTQEGMEFEGRQHSGRDDAFNTARLLRLLLWGQRG